MAQEKAIVLGSGGLNSAVLTAIATKNHDVALLHIRYGHRAAEREAECFQKQADFFGVQDRLVVDMPHFVQIGGNARVNKKLQIEDARAMEDGPSKCNVPGLITTLLSTGFTWASAVGATKIFLGTSENLGPPAPCTSGLFPEYAREVIEACNDMIHEASPGKKISVKAPLTELVRADIIRLGQRLAVPFELTWSCLSSGTEPCGACVGCATRHRGFLDAALPDPIMLQTATPP